MLFSDLCLASKPQESRTLMEVTRIQWLMTLNLASILIPFIIFSIDLTPITCPSYHGPSGESDYFALWRKVFIFGFNFAMYSLKEATGKFLFPVAYITLPY